MLLTALFNAFLYENQVNLNIAFDIPTHVFISPFWQLTVNFPFAIKYQK